MIQHCPRCRRANPERAAYCHFDGALLRQGTAVVPTGQLLQEFTFPSGRRCRTYDELVQGCYQEWDDARQLMRDGTFVSFLSGQGRGDLSKLAREAQSHPDPDMGLTTFLAALPASGVQGPKLGFTPRRMNLGPFHVGESRQAQVRIVNEGTGVLSGKITVADGAGWLRLQGGSDERTFPLHVSRDQTVTLKIETTGLVVGQNYASKLVLVTAGGVAELPIRLELAARSFPLAPFQGASSPQDLARRMKNDPKAAVPLLQGGTVARWFGDNGWNYPIVGAAAPGLACVQQFFEELGMARPPDLQVSTREIRLRCTAPDSPAGQVVLQTTTARRLVYARCEGDRPWIRIASPVVSGQSQATMEFNLDPVGFPDNGTHQGTLRIIGNGGQVFQVKVIAEVHGVKKGQSTGSRPVSTLASSPAAGSSPVAPASSALPAWLAGGKVAQQPVSATAPSPSSTAQPPTVTPAPVPPPRPAWQPEPAQAPRPAARLPAQPACQPAPWSAPTSAPAPVSEPEPFFREEVPAEPAVPRPSVPVWSPLSAESPVANTRVPLGTALGQGIAMGAFAGLLGRLLLIAPADLYARMFGGGTTMNGTLQAWLQVPPPEEGFLRLFVLATWWVGALVGGGLIWRQGGKWIDVGCGLLAGSFAGLVGAATVGSALVLGDSLPRELLGVLLGARETGSAVGTLLWLLTALCCWLFLGAAIGAILGLTGTTGRAILTRIGQPVAWLLRTLRLASLADLFDLHGARG